MPETNGQHRTGEDGMGKQTKKSNENRRKECYKTHNYS
uniref:Uncharacterized protein n=1 Tax=Arundo donax TaxID=35708 RepID=A0A0A9A407_ARUDO